MKQYLLLLKSSDFNKSGNIWISNPINLYANDQYLNYSYVRSPSGLNIIGDRTFVGTEVTSPSIDGSHSTPLTSAAQYVTDFGEIIRDAATPDVLRFVDTKSRIDILSYRHIFTNISGFANPTLRIQFFEADSEDGPWLKSVVAGESNVIFNRNCKQYIKLELEVFSDGLDIESLGLVFYLEIGIYDTISPVISRSAREILRRFPSWTKLYEDSIEASTPELAIPVSVGGAFLNALVQENIDDIEARIDLHTINSFISTANTSQIAWCYISSDVNANIVKVKGDDVELARVSDLPSFFNCRPTDYAFYYNPFDRQLMTLRKFENLVVNDTTFEQEPISIFNEFDEFGARVSLPRLYLEPNENYKARILDVMINPPGASLEGFKRTLRRELDLWRAYGSTPDSSAIGATPLVYEISDIEYSTPYFTPSGVVNKSFKTFVDNINQRFPVNLGYVKWGETVWDYAGLEQQGIGRIAAQYDVNSDLFINNYQNGVGDIDDLKVYIEQSENLAYDRLDEFAVSGEQYNFSGDITISGIKTDYNIPVHLPVIVDYQWYVNYIKYVSDYDSSLVRSALVYEIDLKPHANYATPSTFYADINYDNNSLMLVGNQNDTSSSASPEFHLVKVFDHEGFSIVKFKDKSFNTFYLNTDSTPYSDQISIFDAETVRVTFGSQWDPIYQAYQNIDTDSFRFTFNFSTPNWIPSPTPGSSASMSSPDVDVYNANFLVGSNLYPEIQKSFNSEIFSDSIFLNSLNQESTITGATVNTSDLIRNIVLPADATPNYVFIDVLTPNNLGLLGEDSNSELRGGRVYDPQMKQEYIVPSSPNITFASKASDGSVISGPDFFESATINYASTPAYIDVGTNDGEKYPIPQTRYTYFESSSTPNIVLGLIEPSGEVFKTATDRQNNFGNDSFLENIELKKQTFNLESESSYDIREIVFSATPNSVLIYTEDAPSMVSALNAAVADDSSIRMPVHAKNKPSDELYEASVIPGWILANGEEYYLYYDPKEEVATGRYFSIKLDDSPKRGAPILVEVGDKSYRNLVFQDPATPGGFTFENTEIIKANYSNNLFLAYENVRDITVRDMYVDQIVFNVSGTESNIIEPFTPENPPVLGREYEVIYYVNDAFHVEKDRFNKDEGTYETEIYFSSTPDVESSYKVIYETDPQLKPKRLDLNINQTENPLNEGFIYASLIDYDFARAGYNLSPNYIVDSYDELMQLSLISYDVNGNAKPGQTFSVEGEYISATPQYVTTNDNGLANAIIRYAGPIPALAKESSISISGIGFATPNGGLNSQSEGYSLDIPFKILRSNEFRLELKAVPYRYKIDANNFTNNSFIGQVYWKGKPLEAELEIQWGQARTLRDLFTKSNTYLSGTNVRTNLDGSFQIVGAVVVSDADDPGYWFANIEIADEDEVIAALEQKGETIYDNDVTIAGDIIYWYESYDSVHFTSEYTPLPNVFIFEKQIDSDMKSTPGFVYRYNDQSSVENVSTPANWLPPRWVPLRRYDQYQLGLFGSTPYYISTYSSIHPDSREN